MAESRRNRVAVLGGGVAGVTAAGVLARDPNHAVTLFERASDLGGLQKTVEIDGRRYDIGSFLFGEDHELFVEFPTIRDRYPSARPLLQSITPTGALDAYPSTPRGFLRDHGPAVAARAVASLLEAKVRHRRRDSIPSLLRYYLGDVVFTRSGFRTYLERLYGLPEDEIDLEFADKRLYFIRDVCSLRARIRRGLSGLSGPAGSFSAPQARVRPPDGFGGVFREIGAELGRKGVSIRTGSDIRGIARGSDGVFTVREGEGEEPFDGVISTLPITTTARLLGIRLGVEPEYMALVSLFYSFRGEVGHDAAILCNLTAEGRWKRLTHFSRLYGTGTLEHLTVEVTVPSRAERAEEELDRDFRDHVARLGLYRGELRLDGSRRTSRAYPVYRRSYMTAVRDAREQLENTGIHLWGRQGRFEYLASGEVARGAKALGTRISGSG